MSSTAVRRSKSRCRGRRYRCSSSSGDGRGPLSYRSAFERTEGLTTEAAELTEPTMVYSACSANSVVNKHSVPSVRSATSQGAAGTVHSAHDCSHRCNTGAQPALLLRIGPQIQALLPRERRSEGCCQAGQGCRGTGCGSLRGGHGGSDARTKTQDPPALEGDYFPWLRPALADATQGRWRLSELVRAFARGVLFARLENQVA